MPRYPTAHQLPKARVALTVLIVALGVGQQASAQSLTLSIFEQYLNSLREQAAIPGLSAAIVQNGALAWKNAWGRQDVEGSLAARTDTPYQIGGLSQALGSALLLRRCVDESYLTIGDKVTRWDSSFPESQTTIANLLTHASPAGGYHRDLSRFAQLTPVIAQCSSASYRRLVAGELFEPLRMYDSVPEQALASPTAADQREFDAGTLSRYAGVVRRLAVPYRIDRSGHAVRSDYTARPLDMSTGMISTVLDLANFAADLSIRRSGGLLDVDTLNSAWSSAAGLPTGLGWFVQQYNGEKVVWQYGYEKDAYSSLMLTLPNRDITLILLANSDGLSAPFALENGDITTSLFAKLFLRLVTGQ
jgi:CubicO group peptidase (beta-lactamase class C family)